MKTLGFYNGMKSNQKIFKNSLLTGINRFYEEVFTPRDEIVGDFTD